jgi:hypothetical protein
MTPTAGSPPQLSVAMNPANNQIVGQTYDANGNELSAPQGGTLTYDSENRLLTAPGVQYAYDSRNKRVWAGTLNGSGILTSQVAFIYGAYGQMLGEYSIKIGSSSLTVAQTSLSIYFGKKRIGVTNSSGVTSAFASDRIGSAGPLTVKAKVGITQPTLGVLQRTGRIQPLRWITQINAISRVNSGALLHPTLTSAAEIPKVLRAGTGMLIRSTIRSTVMIRWVSCGRISSRKSSMVCSKLALAQQPSSVESQLRPGCPSWGRLASSVDWAESTLERWNPRAGSGTEKRCVRAQQRRAMLRIPAA